MKTSELSTCIDWSDYQESPIYQRICANFVRAEDFEAAAAKHWLVPGLIAEREFVVMYGKPGAGKSILATDTAAKLSAGLNWDGSEADLIHQVLYIAAERPDQVARRAQAFEKHHQPRDGLSLLIYRGGIDLSRPGRQLFDIIESSTIHFDGDYPRMVVIDTISAAMTLPDSDTNATASATGNILNAIRDTGCAVLAISHMPLSGEQRVRGGHFEGAADTTVMVSKKGDLHTAEVVKNNDSKARPKITYRLDGVNVGYDSEGEELSAPVLVPVESAAEKLVQAVKLSRAAREDLDVLRTLLKASDAVSADEWRTACDAIAGDIAEDGKRKRFNRSKKALIEAKKVKEDNGFFEICS